MIKQNVFIGIARCHKTDKVYGVRLEDKTSNRWTATWAFSIKEETAQREGYTQNQFPTDLNYEADYPCCPYCHEKEDLASNSRIEVAQKSSQKSKLRIMVGAKSNWDDLGAVLSSMGINWRVMGDLKDCDILFLNCSGQRPGDSALKDFVSNGGCVFASCTQDGLLESVFAESIQFDSIGYKTGIDNALIIDEDLYQIVGASIPITFHTAGWGNPSRGNFDTIMSSQGNLFDKGTKLCVRATYGKGEIFFTMFYNSDNLNKKEQALLKLLVLKGIGNSQNANLAQIGSSLNINMDYIKAKFRSDI